MKTVKKAKKGGAVGGRTDITILPLLNGNVSVQ